jgi:hypothetical protein
VTVTTPEEVPVSLFAGIDATPEQVVTNRVASFEESFEQATASAKSTILTIVYIFTLIAIVGALFLAKTRKQLGDYEKADRTCNPFATSSEERVQVKDGFEKLV